MEQSKDESQYPDENLEEVIQLLRELIMKIDQ